VDATDQNDMVRRAQALRLRRMFWGFSSQTSTWIIIAGVYALGMLPAQPILVYFCLVALINLCFFSLFKFNLNLWFKDPSLTAAQIIMPMWPRFISCFLSLTPRRA
jgi:diguanylate cyclase